MAQNDLLSKQSHNMRHKKKQRTIGDVGDFTQDVVSADLFISLWWADEGLADHGNVDFGADTPARWLRGRQSRELRRAAA